MYGIWCKVLIVVIILNHSTHFQFSFKVLIELRQNNSFLLPGDGWTITCNETSCCGMFDYYIIL
ncbi:unnamed protein product [Schistosoma mattheei]|uniref:Uncharacterized protein n=1 Tax=Schistosoma mattheei TaxID=31246 RepID=A0A183NTE9_9TREM|nr:unnamed protein product [Schistosoma mattheei]